MLDGKGKPDDSGYKSPIRKLAKFFENSRDSWKSKCQEAKYKAKMLQNKLRYLEKRKAELNKRVKKLEEELQEYRQKKNDDG
ncbi:hypothetical protein [Desulfococcus multivorans]|uniref:hypothetical protein n=1 Tax=Desulfococcus multivorans TaxID=897 RepID=UPI0008A6D125|nr:hypothetical protein [Desulfococcus multivorans]AOY59043.1 uncharacterized protein Dmul_22710 [Desulfococcus multivorans]AQV01298.1 hypothetical protein B2D07_11350 [Desulfococcus multivorans]